MIKEESRFKDSCVFEGMTSIRALLDNLKDEKSNARKIEKILFDKDKEKSKFKELGYLRKMAELFGFSVEGTTAEVIDGYTVGASHGGIIALCKEKNYPKITSEKIVENGFYVMIEGIEDPYNFGYALRSIYASGADGIILSERNWLSAAGVVCRSSAGASERLNVFIATDDFITLFKERGYSVVCADIKNSVSVYDANLKKPILLIVGGEKRGISSAILNQADQIVRIDYGRKFDAALSAASAATILAFEIYRNNK
ncbi:MAG: RNA methyltransferase [Ruminococcaceae bacterium]|nr:RNA methyltransferase [Oscillospiraceae bacterium]